MNLSATLTKKYWVLSMTRFYKVLQGFERSIFPDCLFGWIIYASGAWSFEECSPHPLHMHWCFAGELMGQQCTPSPYSHSLQWRGRLHSHSSIGSWSTAWQVHKSTWCWSATTSRKLSCIWHGLHKFVKHKCSAAHNSFSTSVACRNLPPLAQAWSATGLQELVFMPGSSPCPWTGYFYNTLDMPYSDAQMTGCFQL